jgi:putative transposase
VLLSLVYRLLACLFGLLAVLARSDLSKDTELVALRHENQVLRRHLSGRLRWDHADRVLWVPKTYATWSDAPLTCRLFGLTPSARA